MDIEEIENYNQLENILEDSSWQNFERIVGKIFDLHGYDVEISKVVSFESTRRQYDVIAEKGHFILVDCKKWDNKRRIKSGLKRAVEDQIERARKLESCKSKYPILVMSSQTPIEFHKKVPVIPVYKLNEFLMNFQTHKRSILKA